MIASDQGSLDIFVWSDDRINKSLACVLNATMTLHPIIWINE